MRVPLSEEDRAAKCDALAHHVTQVRPLSDRPGDEVLLGEHVLAHFDRSAELFVLVAPDQSAVFDRVHSDAEDPWDVDTSWYERRKREVLLGCLPRPRYERVLDIGCSTGALTAELAQRAGAVTAWTRATSPCVPPAPGSRRWAPPTSTSSTPCCPQSGERSGLPET